jgi:hypothetical protein
MATQQEMEATYNYMDEIFRLSLGETGDLTCAMYNGDFSKTLAQAQRDKHAYVLDALNFHTGFRMLEIGCGWGPMLEAAEERRGQGGPEEEDGRRADEDGRAAEEDRRSRAATPAGGEAEGRSQGARGEEEGRRPRAVEPNQKKILRV